MSGALESVADAMNHHFDDAVVVAHGIAVLASFFATSDPKLQERLISQNSGTCDMIMRAIDTHTMCDEVVGQVLAVFLGLLFFESDELKKQVLQKGIQEKIVKINFAHKNYKDVNDCGYWFLEMQSRIRDEFRCIQNELSGGVE